MSWLRRQSDPVRAEFEADTLVHLDALYANALRLTRNRTEAEDLVQETFVKALRFYDHFERGTNIKAWLFRVQYNTFVNRYRRGVRERDAQSNLARDLATDTAIGQEALRALVDPEAGVLRPMLARELGAAMAELPEEQRVVIALADVEGLSYKEIAAAVGCPIGTVMSRLHRARRALREHLVAHAGGAAEGVADAGGAVDADAPGARDARQDQQPVSLEAYRKGRVR
jgi:RNA polymerase sigma-70 factor (ECF subfamily)